MLVNLSDVFTSSERVLQQDIAYERTEFSDGLKTYAVIAGTPFHFSFSNLEEGKAKLEGEGSITLKMQCDRCLQEVETLIPLTVNREVLSPDRLNPEDAEDQVFVQDYMLDVDALINSEILLSLPMKVLCRPDCKGICMVCGQNLNLGECGCDTFVPDPRMVAIKDIFNARKEV